MREIKFRAWDGELKEMIRPEEVLSCSFIGLNGEWLGLGDLLKGEGGFELMQYTGLKDKNGVEIYEGDIVSDKYANIYTPIFRNGIYMAYNVEYLHLTEQEPSTQFNVVWKSGCEIIGNIYDNPELLKEEPTC